MTDKAIGRAFEQPFHDEAAVWLQWGNFEAAVLPNIGANLIAFRDTLNSISFLREPAADQMDDFRARPIVHGIPLLFPPNRYEDGKFPWNGTTYNFPITEEARNNHLHGFFHNAKFDVLDYGTTKTESFVVLSISVHKDHPIYTYLPHTFTIQLRYSLSEQGLFQHVQVRNEGNDALPCLIAFHTTLNAPFDSASSSDDYRFQMTIGNRWEMSERMLPSGKFQPLLKEEELMKSEGISPFWAPMDNHYTAVPQNGRNQMVLTDTRTGISLVYDVGTAYKQWMIYNNNATPGFFCPEPQTNLVNAPNVDIDADTAGVVSLEQGGIWEETGRLYVKYGK